MRVSMHPRVFRTSALMAVGLLLLPAHRSPLTAQAPSAATKLARAVSPAAYLAHLEFLADDGLEGRAPATRGGELAAKYIAAQFARLGLEPAGDSGTYFHRVPIIALRPEPTLKSRKGTDPAV